MAKKDLDKIRTLALKRFENVENAERSQRRLAIEDALFVNAEDGQWDEETISKRRDRPRFTIDKISGALDQLVGDQRQNSTNIKVRPIGGGATEDVAKIFEGLIRNIENQSKAGNAYDTAYDEAITGGYGGFRILTELNDDDIFEQDIKIKTIKSAASSLWFDPSATEYDKKDAKWAFLTTFMPKEEFLDRFPKATVTDFSQSEFSNSTCTWFKGDDIRIAEYWVKEPTTKRIGKMSDGRIINLDEEVAVLDELAGQGVTVIDERTVEIHKIKMYIMNGAEILKEPFEWAGKYIPLIPVFGKTSKVEDKTYVRGLVRKGKDPQRVYNYATSANIETVALSAKDPVYMTPVQVAGHEEQFRTSANKNQPYMLYNPDPKAPGIPQRGGSPSVQQALILATQQAGNDIEATTGIFAPALGNAPSLLSEKSVISQAEKGDRGSYIFTDNLTKSIQYAGEILIDLIPKIYDTERTVRILHLDGKSENTKINIESTQMIGEVVTDEQTGEKVEVNDIALGKYDVVTDIGPAFKTQREQSTQQLIDLTNASPLFAEITPDLIAKNINVLESDEIAKRMRKIMIQKGIAEPTKEEIKELGLAQPQQPDPSQVALIENVQMQTAKLQADIENQDAKTEKLFADIQKTTIEGFSELMTAFKKQAEAGIPLTPQNHDMRVSQNDIVQIGQEAVLPNGVNSEQAEDLAGVVQEGVDSI